MKRCLFVLCGILIGSFSASSTLAQEKRFHSQLTLRDVKITSVAVDNKSKYMAVGLGDGRLLFFTIKADKFRFFTPWSVFGKNAITAITFSADDTEFATAGNDGTVKIWSTEKAKDFAEETEKLTEKEARKVKPPVMKAIIKAHPAGTVLAAYHPDGKRLATAGVDGNIKFWKIDSPTKPVLTIPAHKGAVHAIAFSKMGDLLASGGADKKAKLWTVSEEVKVLHTLPDQIGPVFAVAFQPDGKLLATGSGAAKQPGELKLWETDTGKLAYSLVGHDDAVTCIWFHPKEKRLVSGSKDKSLRVWNLETQKEMYKDLHSDGLHTVFFLITGDLLGSFSPEEGKWWIGTPKLP